MSDSTPIGGGYYVQGLTFGLSIGIGTNGKPTGTAYTQVGAGVGAAGGFSFSSDGVSPYAAVGAASITGTPGVAWSILYDFPTGHTFFSFGGGVSDFAEMGGYYEFPAWGQFKEWYEENFPDAPALPDNPPPGGEEAGDSTGLAV